MSQIDESSAIELQMLRMLGAQVRRLAVDLSTFANDLDACLALACQPRFAEHALIKARHVVEQMTRQLCHDYQIEWNPHNLSGCIDKLEKTPVPLDVVHALHNARSKANLVAHKDAGSGKREALKLNLNDITVVVMQLIRVLQWYFCEKQPPRLASLYGAEPLLFHERVNAFVRQFHAAYQPYSARDAALADPEKIFVPLRCQPLGDGPPQDALRWVQGGLQQPGGVLLLADYGMGKSFLALQVFLTLAADYAKDPDHAPAPVLFPLKRHRLRLDQPDGLIDDLFEFLLTQSFPVVERTDLLRVMSEGRLLLILDGLDEIPLVQTVDDIDTVLDRIDPTRFGAKHWIVTSRFGLFARRLARTGGFTRMPTARLLNWDDSQWHTFVETCDIGLHLFDRESADAAASRQIREQFVSAVAARPALQQLTVTPLFARMLVEARDGVVARGDVDLVQLYDLYIDRVLSSRQDVSLLRSAAMRRQCLEALAVFLFEQGRTACTAEELVEFADRFVRNAGRQELLSFVSTELQSYSLLNCDGAGRMSFSHKSFYEYFLATAAIAEVRTGGWSQPGPIWRRRLDPGELEFLAKLLTQPALASRRAELECTLKSTPLVPDPIFWRNVLAIKLAAGLSLEGAHLADLELSGMNFAGCNLRGACMDGVRAVGVDFSGADLTGCSFAGAILERSRLNGADLSGAILDFAHLTDLDQDGEVPKPAGASFFQVRVSQSDCDFLTWAVKRDARGTPEWKREAVAHLEAGIA